MKNKSTAYLLWLIGCHHFYLGKPAKGVFYLLTGGFFVIGAIIDLFTMGSLVDNCNTQHELKTIRTTTMANLNK